MWAAVAGDARRQPAAHFAAAAGGGCSLPRTPPSDLEGFLRKEATANESYCWKNAATRAEQCGHSSYPMKTA